ncbi:nucleoside 2-deoxyribosyltransferase [uncultured Desulfobacter sp.]|uniref:nucleoside 2-deoxyribosyltransferase n=1 Tax=uncultured Desulfobacter sp. TaxID=240139 RepID=UPI0029F54281|nr:nucleoside 2-deoxyribosyltransferase [uncultured Desulfobacter sp.]
MKKIYLAGPLFSLAEREFNILFAQMIESGMNDVEVILPQKRASRFLSLENGKKLIFEDCLKMVEKADIVLAILDGPDADSGTSVELGYAYAIKTPIIGVRTDFRISEDKGLNLMLSNICSTLIIDISSDMTGLVNSVIKAIGENL